MSSRFVPLCFLCGSQAPLETCKADECGRPVHEECYVARLVMRTNETAVQKMPCEVNPGQWREFERWQAARRTSMVPQRENRFPLQMSRRGAEMAVVVVALAVACLFTYSGHRASLPGASALQGSIAVGRPQAFAPAVKTRANRTSTPQAKSLPLKVKSAEPAFKQVQVGENEVDYVTDDVTVRYFSYNLAVQRVRAGYRQFDIGEDVTVRYFPHDAAVASAIRPASHPAHPPGVGKPASSKVAR